MLTLRLDEEAWIDAIPTDNVGEARSQGVAVQFGGEDLAGVLVLTTDQARRLWHVVGKVLRLVDEMEEARD